MVYTDVTGRAQELCESRGGGLGLPVPNSPRGLCGRQATLNLKDFVSQSRLTFWLERYNVIICPVSMYGHQQDVKIHLVTLKKEEVYLSHFTAT